MKILSASQLREADAYTIANEPIASIDLMERAVKDCTEWLLSFPASPLLHPQTKSACIVCGSGNNGGDGLAIARLLAKKGYKTDVVILRFSEKYSDDFLMNEKRLAGTNKVTVHNIYSFSDFTNLSFFQSFESAVVIDAIFGSGLSRPVSGWVADVISFINKLNLPVVSIDIPSGLFCDDNSENDLKAVIKAAHTLTFELPKLSFLFADCAKYTGEWHIIPIGLSPEFISQQKTCNYYITKEMVVPLLSHRKKISHKGNYGHALIVSGSYGKMGATVLASKACLRAGAGLLTVRIPRCGYHIIQTAVPEAMTLPDESENFLSSSINTEKFNAIGIGPGIGVEENTKTMFKQLIQVRSLPMVIDADAINILGENKTWLSFLPAKSILTPHPKEFERIAGKSKNNFERYLFQISFAKKYNVYVVLKGANTSIACPNGDVYFNSTGNPGMATAGSGDVLTGIITGLLAQGYSPLESAVLGVYIHGLAGDIAAKYRGMDAMIAGDIIEYLGDAFLSLY